MFLNMSPKIIFKSFMTARQGNCRRLVRPPFAKSRHLAVYRTFDWKILEYENKIHSQKFYYLEGLISQSEHFQIYRLFWLVIGWLGPQGNKTFEHEFCSHTLKSSNQNSRYTWNSVLLPLLMFRSYWHIYMAVKFFIIHNIRGISYL
jgi:hypothetical protein